MHQYLRSRGGLGRRHSGDRRPAAGATGTSRSLGLGVGASEVWGDVERQPASQVGDGRRGEPRRRAPCVHCCVAPSSVDSARRAPPLAVSPSRRVAVARHQWPAVRRGPRGGSWPRGRSRGSLGGGGQMRMDGREEKNERNPRNPADFFIYFQLRSTCQG
jgi:hypothetical protein